MIEIIETDLIFTFYYTADKQGATGLTVTADVYNPAGTKVITAGACAELGGGLYTYTLDSAYNLTKGKYRAIGKTTDADVDVQHIPCQLQVYTSLSSIIEGSAGTFGRTLADFRWMLRVRLDDIDTGEYATDELDYCINLAYREIQMLTKCYIKTDTIAAVSGTSEYSLSTVFEPISVTYAGKLLKKAKLADIVANDPAKLTDTGVPDADTCWIWLEGKKILILPIPTGESLGSFLVKGHAEAVAMTDDADTPDALPYGFDISVILDRAEAEARKIKLTHANNMAMYDNLMTIWNAEIAAMKAALKES
jgi:hypothetical protein